MKPTDALIGEHRVIEQVLACVEKMADRSLSEGVLDSVAARKAIDFLRIYGDCHHEKEEKCLFPMLESRGFAREHGPIGRMLYEHDHGRGFLQELAAAVEGASPANPESIRRFVDRARSYIYWLREHIVKEDQQLFPVANHALKGEDQSLLLEAFQRMERHEAGPGKHAECIQWANELADRFDVPRAHWHAEGAVDNAACAGPGGH